MNDFSGLIGPVSPPEKVKLIAATNNSFRRMIRTRWAWYPFIPLGEITLLTGPTDVGKSTVCLDLAGAFTTGKLDGEYRGEPINILYVALEDTIEIDITPKLEATGANRALCWDLVVQNGWVNLPQDLNELGEKIDENNIKVIFLDPITSVIAGDRNKADVIRPALELIREFAAQKGIAIVGVAHQRKGNSGTATEGVSGSAEWVNVSRCVLAVKEHREDPGKFILSISKSNRAPRDQRRNLIYTFEHKPVEMDDEEAVQMTPKIQWLGETGISVDDMMQDSANGVQGGETSDAATWLEAYLADNGGEATVADIIKAGKGVGLGDSALRAAQKRLKLASETDLRGPRWLLSRG